ncbi:hypothetical protein [Caballeronia sp. SBC2]|uniref:hypothetical protein n=1 Tax=Caballeronia sp. SBC2 TaxID=2705547 RepID=UPI0013E1DDC6|nr:hypothetical protein SBC2_78140 [Caballeronia sp. SBC2]
MHKTVLTLLLPASLLTFSSLPADAADADPSGVKPMSAPAQAEPHMQKVLDALASLGGKPIETLTPEEARCSRRQRTP